MLVNLDGSIGSVSGVVLRQTSIYYEFMGRLLAILLLIQISLPGFCCFANRVVRSTASLVGFASSDGSLDFLSKSCCGNKCCIPNPHDSSDCCSSGSCCGTESGPGSTGPEQRHSNQPEKPTDQEVCECLDSDPMIPPSTISLDIDLDHGIYELNSVPQLLASRLRVKAARYHPPPLRRHLFLCVIRC